MGVTLLRLSSKPAVLPYDAYFSLSTPRTLSPVLMHGYMPLMLNLTKTDLEPASVASLDRVPETYIYDFAFAAFSRCGTKINQREDARVRMLPPTSLV